MKYIVASPKMLTRIEAHHIDIRDGVLMLVREDATVVTAIAPGHWISVREETADAEVTAAVAKLA